MNRNKKLYYNNLILTTKKELETETQYIKDLQSELFQLRQAILKPTITYTETNGLRYAITEKDKQIKKAQNRRDKIILKLHDLNQTYQSL